MESSIEHSEKYDNCETEYQAAWGAMNAAIGNSTSEEFEQLVANYIAAQTALKSAGGLRLPG